MKSTKMRMEDGGKSGFISDCGLAIADWEARERHHLSPSQWLPKPATSQFPQKGRSLRETWSPIPWRRGRKRRWVVAWSGAVGAPSPSPRLRRTSDGGTSAGSAERWRTAKAIHCGGFDKLSPALWISDCGLKGGDGEAGAGNMGGTPSIVAAADGDIRAPKNIGGAGVRLAHPRQHRPTILRKGVAYESR